MSEYLKTYPVWKEEYEILSGMKIIDDSGARILESEGRLDTLLTYKEALKYLLTCTQMWKDVC